MGGSACIPGSWGREVLPSLEWSCPGLLCMGRQFQVSSAPNQCAWDIKGHQGFCTAEASFE